VVVTNAEGGWGAENTGDSWIFINNSFPYI